jgi:hypothetical protein
MYILKMGRLSKSCIIIGVIYSLSPVRETGSSFPQLSAARDVSAQLEKASRDVRQSAAYAQGANESGLLSALSDVLNSLPQVLNSLTNSTSQPSSQAVHKAKASPHSEATKNKNP